MAKSACSARSSRQDQRHVPDAEEGEQMQVLAALLGCLIVAEQADREAFGPRGPAILPDLA
jgi:hypothetical protein